MLDGLGSERDRSLWAVANETVRAIGSLVPHTLAGMPLSLPTIDLFRAWRSAERAGSKLDGVQENALREWSDWRTKVTWTEGENASKLQSLLDAYATLGDLRTRYPDRDAFTRAMDALLEFMHEHYRVKRVPEDVAKRRWLATHVTKRFDVMPAEWRDPEHKEAT